MTQLLTLPNAGSATNASLRRGLNFALVPQLDLAGSKIVHFQGGNVGRPSVRNRSPALYFTGSSANTSQLNQPIRWQDPNYFSCHVWWDMNGVPSPPRYTLIGTNDFANAFQLEVGTIGGNLINVAVIVPGLFVCRTDQFDRPPDEKLSIVYRKFGNGANDQEIWINGNYFPIYSDRVAQTFVNAPLTGIGWRAAANQTIRGYVDNIAGWDRILTPAEIRLLANDRDALRKTTSLYIPRPAAQPTTERKIISVPTAEKPRTSEQLKRGLVYANESMWDRDPNVYTDRAHGDATVNLIRQSTQVEQSRFCSDIGGEHALIQWQPGRWFPGHTWSLFQWCKYPPRSNFEYFWQVENNDVFSRNFSFQGYADGRFFYNGDIIDPGDEKHLWVPFLVRQQGTTWDLRFGSSYFSGTIAEAPTWDCQQFRYGRATSRGTWQMSQTYLWNRWIEDTEQEELWNTTRYDSLFDRRPLYIPRPAAQPTTPKIISVPRATNPHEQIQRRGLIRHYQPSVKFDAQALGAAWDFSDRSNTRGAKLNLTAITATGVKAVWCEPVNGWAFEPQSGENGELLAPIGPEQFGIRPNIAFSFWANRLARQQGQFPFACGTSTTSGKYYALQTQNQAWRFSLWGGGSTSYTASAFPDNRWVHVLLTDYQNDARIYWDGELVASGTFSGWNFDNLNTTFGAEYSNWRALQVADLRVYFNAAAPEILANSIYRSPRALYERQPLYVPIPTAAPTPDLAADLTESDSITADLAVEAPGDVILASDLDDADSITADLTLEAPGDVILASDLGDADSITADLAVETPGDVQLAADLADADSITADLLVDRPLAADLADTDSITADLSVDIPGVIVLEADLADADSITADLIVDRALAADISDIDAITATLSFVEEKPVGSLDFRVSAQLTNYRTPIQNTMWRFRKP